MNTRWSYIVSVVLAMLIYEGRDAALAQPGGDVADVLARVPKTELPVDRVDVPMDLSIRLPTVEVKVNGQGPFRFAVDTGSGATLVDNRLAVRLQLPVLGTGRNDASSGTPVGAMYLVHVETIELQEATFRNTKAVRRDLAEIFPGGHPPDGVLGFPLFAKCLLTLDYPQQRVRLEKGTLPAADGKDVVTYEIKRRTPTVNLSIGEIPVAVGIDSGARAGNTLTGKLEGKVPLQAAPVVTGKTRIGDASIDLRTARLNSTVSLGRHQIKEPIIRFARKGSVFAYEVLKHFAVTFDQQGSRVRFRRGTEAPITFPPLHSAGFGAEPHGGGRKVWYVLDGLPAKKAGLRVGDVIKAVNGRAVADYPPAAWEALFEGAGKFTLMGEREGKPLEITLKTTEVVH